MKRLSVDLIRAYVKHGLIGPLAKELDLHRNTLSLKLRGEVALRLDEINAIADYLDVDVDRFLRDEPEHPALTALRNAPVSNEPYTDEDRQAVEEARQDIRAGRVYSHEEVARRIRE